jgi:hypothetical protein
MLKLDINLTISLFRCKINFLITIKYQWLISLLLSNWIIKFGKDLNFAKWKIKISIK